MKGNENQNPPNGTIQPNTIEGKNQIEYNIKHYQQCIHGDDFYSTKAFQTTDGDGNQIDVLDNRGRPVLYPLKSGMPGFDRCEGFPLPHE